MALNVWPSLRAKHVLEYDLRNLVCSSWATPFGIFSWVRQMYLLPPFIMSALRKHTGLLRLGTSWHRHSVARTHDAGVGDVRTCTVDCRLVGALLCLLDVLDSDIRSVCSVELLSRCYIYCEVRGRHRKSPLFSLCGAKLETFSLPLGALSATCSSLST